MTWSQRRTAPCHAPAGPASPAVRAAPLQQRALGHSCRPRSQRLPPARSAQGWAARRSALRGDAPAAAPRWTWRLQRRAPLPCAARVATRRSEGPTGGRGKRSGACAVLRGGEVSKARAHELQERSHLRGCACARRPLAPAGSQSQPVWRGPRASRRRATGAYGKSAHAASSLRSPARCTHWRARPRADACSAHSQAGGLGQGKKRPGKVPPPRRTVSTQLVLAPLALCQSRDREPRRQGRPTPPPSATTLGPSRSCTVPPTKLRAVLACRPARPSRGGAQQAPAKGGNSRVQ